MDGHKKGTGRRVSIMSREVNRTHEESWSVYVSRRGER